ncbi:MAG: AAA family ATPase [Actinobacteria bacterium]|nr:AAA family ATPase [Actinomycetota bacterium]
MDSAGTTPTTLERELAIEQAHVDLVYEHLEQATRSARKVASQGQDIYRSDRETWVREEDGTALFERDAFAFQAARRLAILDAEHEGLVFGRLDHTDGEVRYIGRIGVRDAEYEPLVIDWRARAAEPFYRATPSDPMDVVRRRVLRCRNDIVIGIEDDLLDNSHTRDDLVIIGDGALMAALKRARGPRMRDIVATIQAEQDEAIRADHQGVTVISGGPGTGKTVVALHRAAYLLYSNRRRFERGGILVVGPSGLFMDYIERVLPSLGEDSVTLRPIGGVAVDTLGFTASRIDAADAANLKGSLRMVPLLKRLVNLPLLDAGTDQAPLRVTVKGEPLTLDAATLGRIRRDVLTRTKANAGRPAAEAAVMAALYEQLPTELEMDLETMTELVSDSALYRMFLQAWWPDLTPTDVLRRLASPQAVARVGEGILDAAEQATLAASFAFEDWSVADTALLDELVAALGPIAPDEAEDPLLFLGEGTETAELVTTADWLRDVREVDPHADPHDTFTHLLVDEAQDISPMQWRMLRRRGSQASWTIVGDPAQSSWPDLAESEKALADLIGSSPHRTFRLSTNYRSPAEVFELAAQIVRRDFPQADLPVAVRSTGVEPELLSASEESLVGDLDATLARLAGEVQGTIGVIVAPSRLPGLAVAELASADGHRGRISFVSPLNAKGLEYDAVVVVGPDEIVAESPGGVRVLYVALTRPTQRLVTLDVGRSAGAWRESLQ